MQTDFLTEPTAAATVFALIISHSPSYKSIQYNATTDYSHCILPAGSSDDISWVHILRRHICRVIEGAVVGVVLIESPYSGVLDGLLCLQLRNRKCIHKSKVSIKVYSRKSSSNFIYVA